MCGGAILVADRHASFGFIPACAGEPGIAEYAAANGVHPRVCGGAALRDTFDSDGDPGPSPRVRGSLSRRLFAIMDSGPSPRVRGSRD